MTTINDVPPTGTGRNWRKIGKIGGGVFVALVALGAVTGDPDQEEVATSNASSAEVTTAEAPQAKAPKTTEAPATTTAPSTTATPTTTAPPTTLPPTTAPPTTQPPVPAETLSQKNARNKANDYLDFMSFSRSGLIGQLEFEGFSTDDATYGVDALNVNWDQQAADKAAEYLDFMSFSHSALVEQLVFEGFSPAQAEYGVSTTGL